MINVCMAGTRVPCSSMNFTLSCNFVSIGSWYFLEDWYESIVFANGWIFF